MVPITDPMLIIREGSPSLAAAFNKPVRFRVNVNIPATLMFITFSQALCGKELYGSPHVMPALFTRISSLSVRALTLAVSSLMASSEPTSPANPSAEPSAFSAFNSAATTSQASPFRLAIKTRAPPWTNASAIMRPMPVAPPVTSAVLPETPNMLSKYAIMPLLKSVYGDCIIATNNAIANVASGFLDKPLGEFLDMPYCFGAGH